MALLIYAGTEVEDLHDTLPEPGRPEGTEEENWTAYEQSKTKLKIHFSPKQCNDFAIFELLRMKIESSESITSYAMRLRKAASKCDFTNWSAEKMIKSLIISNMQDDTLRLKFLQKDRTLDQILDIARKKEDAVARSKVIDRDSRQVVNKVGAKRNQPLQQKGTTDQCNRCGHENHFPASECPAISRICNYCKKKGHYASKCFKKQKEAGIKRIEAEPQIDNGNDTNSDTDEYDTAKIELVNNLGMGEKPSLMRVRTNDQEVLWQPDTGTQKDVRDEAHFRSFEEKTRGEVKLTPTNIKLFAVLVQRASKTEAFHPVMYKSRSLKEVETRYSATEREALAVRWACRKLRKYLLGAPKFRIVTDHRPLTYMFHKLCGELPPRVENFVMDVQEFEYEIVYRPGKTCIADYMSRHHVDRAGSSRVFEIEAAAESVVESGYCHALNEQGTVTVEDIRDEGERCEVYQRLVKAIRSGISDNDEELKPYIVPEIKHDLSVVNGVVCRGSRVVVPIALQKRVVELSHRAHQGISKAKHFLRTLSWFPGMDKAVENQVRGCLPCQAVQPPNNDQPVKPSELPIGPWQYVEMDFQGPYPNGEYIFIMIDRYSRWPEMAWFRNAPNANTTIAAMEKIFTNKGVPAVCQSDNGSPFQSKEMEQFAQKQWIPPSPHYSGMAQSKRNS